MHKEYRLGYELKRYVPEQHNDWAHYAVCKLSRKEWRSFCYNLKRAHSRGFLSADKLMQHPLYLSLVVGDGNCDRTLCYADGVLIDTMIEYYRTEVAVEFARPFPNWKYMKKYIDRYTFWNRVHAIVC